MREVLLVLAPVDSHYGTHCVANLNEIQFTKRNVLFRLSIHNSNLLMLFFVSVV